MTLKLSEKHLFHDETLTQSAHGPLDPTYGQHRQSPGMASAVNNSIGHEEDAEPMDTDDVSKFTCGPDGTPAYGRGQTPVTSPSIFLYVLALACRTTPCRIRKRIEQNSNRQSNR